MMEIEGSNSSPASVRIRQGVGIALGLLVAAYAMRVTLAGGIINPDRPRDLKQNIKLVKSFVLDKQDPREVLSAALKVMEKTPNRARRWSESANQQLDSIINRHRAYAANEEKPGDGAVFDIKAYLETEIAGPLKDLAFRHPHAEEKTALYRPGAHYQVLLASLEPSADLFRTFVYLFHENKWLIEDATFAENCGMLRASKADWTCQIVVLEKGVFPGYKTTMYWNMKKNRPDDEGDEDALPDDDY